MAIRVIQSRARRSGGAVHSSPAITGGVRCSFFLRWSDSAGSRNADVGEVVSVPLRGQSRSVLAFAVVSTLVGVQAASTTLDADAILEEPADARDDKHLVRLIIPTHNRAAQMEVAVRSVLESPLISSPRQVIVVPDDSHDHTPDVVRRLGGYTSRARVIPSPVVAMQAGVGKLGHRVRELPRRRRRGGSPATSGCSLRRWTRIPTPDSHTARRSAPPRRTSHLSTPHSRRCRW